MGGVYQYLARMVGDKAGGRVAQEGWGFVSPTLGSSLAPRSERAPLKDLNLKGT